MFLYRYRTFNNPFWFKKKYILYFWLPRLIVSILFLIFYKYIHLSEDNYNSELINWGRITNFSKYISTYKYNPLYALSLQSIHKLFNNTVYIKFILAQLISGISCISIYRSSKKYLRVSKIALLLIAIHPMLCLYGSRFCTENFGLVSIAIYLATRVKINNLYAASKKEIQNIQLKSILIQFLLTLFRAQNITFFIYEQSCFLKDFIKSYFQQKIKNKKSNLIGIVYFLAISTFVVVLLLSIKNYLYIIPDFLWSGTYLIDPEKVFNFISSNIEINNQFQKIIISISSYIIYLFIGVILITGARERLIQMSWFISIGGFVFNYNYGGNINNSIIIDPSNTNYQIDFIFKMILPLLAFSILHLIGIYQWYRSNKKNGLSISIYPLFICLPPLIILPLMRYFIPLIPISCIGLSILIERLLITKKLV